MVLTIVYIVGVIAACVSAYFAYKFYTRERNRESPDIDLGFAEGDGVVDSIKVQPDTESEIGQRVYFRIRNNSDFSIKTPFCSVKFPEVLKHKRFEDKPDGTRQFFQGEFTVNSDLWGLGRGTTTVRTGLPNSMWEIVGMPAILLRAGETIDFFIRFQLPEKPMTYDLEIKIDAEGTKKLSKKLQLVVIQK